MFADNLLSTLVHDVNVLRGLSGDPAEVLFTDVWAGGESMLTVMRYPSGVRATIALHYLPDLANYQETVAYYAKADRIKLVFPSPFFRNMPTGIVVESMEQGKAVENRVTPSLKEAFKEELIHFAECVGTGTPPITTPEEARGDVALLHKIFHAIKRPFVPRAEGRPRVRLRAETRAAVGAARRPGGSWTGGSAGWGRCG